MAEILQRKQHAEKAHLHLPAPTAWPIVLAFGFTMLAAGLVTDMGISLLGAVLMIAGCRASLLAAQGRTPGLPGVLDEITAGLASLA